MHSQEFEIKPYEDAHRVQVLAVWERSVLATHHFLAPTDFMEIKAEVHGIDFRAFEMHCLVGGRDVIGFVGVADRKVEMLFLDPGHIGKGLGKRLLQFAITHLSATTVDVNAQNEQALGFYARCGFVVHEMTTHDDQGRPYPLHKMRLKG